MEKTATLECLVLLNSGNPIDYTGNLDQILEENINNFNKIFENIVEDVLKTKFTINIPLENIRSRYLHYNFYLVRNLINLLENSEEMLSVQQAKNLTNVFRNIIGIGIASLLHPRLSCYTPLPNEKYSQNIESVEIKYGRMIFTLYELYLCMQSNALKPIITTNYLKFILSALYQILYCPVKKPSGISDEKSDFQMTQEFYNKVLEDRNIFGEVFKFCATKIHPTVYLHGSMLLVNSESPRWLKLAVSANLNEIIKKPKGVEKIIRAMLDASGNENSDDTTRTWKVVDIVARIIVDGRFNTDFEENICKQVVALLDLESKTAEFLYPFEQVFSLCTKYLYNIDKEKHSRFLTKRLFKIFNNLTGEGGTLKKDVTKEVEQGVRILHMCFCENRLQDTVLPSCLLIPYVRLIFGVFNVLFGEKTFAKTADLSKEILLKVLKDIDDETCYIEIFDSLLFDMCSSKIISIKGNLCILNKCGICIERNQHKELMAPTASSLDVVVDLLGDNFRLKKIMLDFLINCLVHKEKYFKAGTVMNLLSPDQIEFLIFQLSKRKQLVLGLICVFLQSEEDVKKIMSENPKTIINYFNSLLANTISTGLHKSKNSETDEMQHLFGFLMVMQLLIKNAEEKTMDLFKPTVANLRRISEESELQELRELAKDILGHLNNFESRKKPRQADDVKTTSDLEQALEDICDPLLPTRGHGLLTLAKLLENKDESAMKKKQYLLNIFQQYLKDEDSFIYLNAIKGLAALGDVFPDTVLSVLCEEYIHCEKQPSKDDGHEIQIKIGEVLVQISKKLGDVAPKYKPLLLNTFLQGAKHDDHLLRASSLSNLGAICQVLSYNLGTIVTEVLDCVHAVITRDKAPEPRRAAVLVLRQLFVGLGKNMVLFLKDEILEIYRSLKTIYRDDKDDIVRLQAQLALEELNENVLNFIFPKPGLTSEMKMMQLK